MGTDNKKKIKYSRASTAVENWSYGECNQAWQATQKLSLAGRLSLKHQFLHSKLSYGQESSGS